LLIGLLVLPGPAGGQRRAVEVVGSQLVEAGLDHDRHLSAGHSDLDCLLRAQQAGADGGIDGRLAIRAPWPPARSP
jgi:hypothetical protein